MRAELRQAYRMAADPVARLRDRLRGSLWEITTAAPQVVLTYDDGPDPVGTEQVLSALADFRATATFFMLNSRARRYPTLVAEVAAAGHDIALHGVDHRRLTEFSPDQVHRRTLAGKRELEDVAGCAIDWFRPPYGSQTLRISRAVARCGLVPVLWTLTMLDWEEADGARRVAAAVDRVRPGSIVVGHDGFAGPDDGVNDGPEPKFHRGTLTRQVLEAYEERGLVGRSLAAAIRPPSGSAGVG